MFRRVTRARYNKAGLYPAICSNLKYPKSDTGGGKGFLPATGNKTEQCRLTGGADAGGPVAPAVQTAAVHNMSLAPETRTTESGLTAGDLQSLKQRGLHNNKADKSKAYLNYVFFDKRLNFVGDGSGVKQVDGEPGKLETLSSGKVVAKQDGYVYVYTSNESQQDVLFDNFGVEDITGPVLEETHYYPFGLTMAGISTKAPLKLENRKKFNGKELNHKEFSDGSGLDWYSYGMREYDPQIGRFFSVDPLTSKYPDLSPYVFVANNPINSIDPNGAWIFHLFGSTSEQRQAARSVTDATSGEIGDFFTKKIHVDYSTADKEINQYSGEIRNIFTKHTVAFRANGHIDYHSEMLNYIADQDIEWGKNHIIDQNGNVHYIPASGGIRSVPVFSLLVPVPPVLKILGAGRVAEVAEEGLGIGEYTFSKYANPHYNEMIIKAGDAENAGMLARPYMRSPLTIKNIMSTGEGIPDATWPGGFNWKVPGTFRGSEGLFELGINPETNVIYHFNFVH